MAALTQDLVTRLQGMVECPVCLEPFKEPRSLPCQHSFCTECLRGIRQTGQAIRCPCCNKETPVPHGVRDLPVDFRANTQLEILSEYERAREARAAELAAAGSVMRHEAQAAVPR